MSLRGIASGQVFEVEPSGGLESGQDLLELLPRLNGALVPSVVEVRPRPGSFALLVVAAAPSLPAAKLLSRPEMRVAHRAALTLDLFSAIEAVDGLGAGHRHLDPELLQVSPEGRLGLAPAHLVSAQPCGREEALREAGDLACWLLGIDERPERELTPTERQAPALAAVARRLAERGAPSAAAALEMIQQAAGQLASHADLTHCRGDVARLVQAAVTGDSEPGRGRGRRARTDPAPRLNAASRLPEPSIRDWRARRAWRRVGLLLGLSASVLTALMLGELAWLLAIPRFMTAITVPALPAPAAVAPTPIAAAPSPPAPAPSPSAEAIGPITRVAITSPGGCQPGASCSLRVDVDMAPAPATTEVAWTFTVTDVCRGTSSLQPGQSVTAQAGWPYVYGISSVALPASGQVTVTARTSSPGQATSSAVSFGRGC